MSALDDIRESARHATVGADDHSDYRDAVEDRARLLGALDAVLALANSARRHTVFGGGSASGIILADDVIAAVNDALEAGK